MTMHVLDRLSNKILIGDGCWEWSGHVKPNGYGQLSLDDGKKHNAHRVVYELVVGPIPPGLDLDHLCRNRRCVRPDHLEPVTRSVNLRRGRGRELKQRQAAQRTHCHKGHVFDEANTYWRPGGSGKMCRRCARIRKGRDT